MSGIHGDKQLLIVLHFTNGCYAARNKFVKMLSFYRYGSGWSQEYNESTVCII